LDKLSAFAVIYERSNTTGNPEVFNRIMERLNHRGPDGSDVIAAGNVMMGHWHFWTTPEEVDERQPLALNGLPFKVVLDGRIDNREELFSKLSITPAEGKSLSDAALVLRAYARWNEDCFGHFVGEFALVIFDAQKNEIVCARDQLGDRTLFYASYGTWMVVASEPWAVVGANGIRPELNERVVAHYFALKIPEDGQTFFNNVCELLPAHIMKVNAGNQRTWCYWQPNLDKKIRYNTDAEYGEHFLALLEEATRCQMRSNTPVGVMMSGGLDSTSVACLAARMISPQQLTTISYVFDELPDCDERQYINAVKEKWNLRSIQIPCDDAWPYKDLQTHAPNPNEPYENPYRLVHDRAFARAREEGLRVILNGGFGDHLYIAGKEWLTDLLFEWHFPTALRELKIQSQSKGLRQALKPQYLRQIARRLFYAIFNRHYTRQKSTGSNWLTQYCINFLSGSQNTSPADERYATLLGLLTSFSSSHTFFNVSLYGLELRSPYRNRRLIEFVLTLPAYQLYSHGINKHILRTSMKNILPEMVSTRTQPTALYSLFFRGVEREKDILESYAQNTDAIWHKFVKMDWLLKHWGNKITRQEDGPKSLVFWLCLSYDAWHKSYVSTN
jgi:asparagine synthase (glutamine-hydrolysing)